MELKSISKIYFIGIGGIGMSAIARYMRSIGKDVYGYDKTETRLTKKLVNEGMIIHYEDRPDKIPKDIDVVVYTPAVPETLEELIEVRRKGYMVVKRAEMLGIISKSLETVAIAGTHGKTTTSAIITHLLKSCGIDVSAFIGGIMSNYDTNYMSGEDNWLVLEADEYDRSFLTLSPNIAAILSMDADHLDIYDEHDAMIRTFNDFILKMSEAGSLIIEDSLTEKITSETRQALEDRDIEIITYGIDKGQINVSDIKVENGVFKFTYRWDNFIMKDVISNLPGEHNVSNAAVAITIARLLECVDEDIREGLENFKGIKRRFEKIVDGKQVYYDDYAHHPSELKAAISAIRRLYPDKKITGIFQPHLYSRTKDFAQGFAEQLDRLDEVILMDIYPARERPIPGITSDTIKDRMKNKKVKRVSKETLLESIDFEGIEVLITMGAGDIDVFVTEIKKYLSA